MDTAAANDQTLTTDTSPNGAISQQEMQALLLAQEVIRRRLEGPGAAKKAASEANPK